MRRLRAARAGFALAVGISLLTPRAWGGEPAAPVPVRPARQIPPVTWSAFLPAVGDTVEELPVRSSILRGRWQGLRRALGAEDTVEYPPGAAPPDQPASVPGQGVAAFPGETEAFHAAFTEAVTRARENDAAGCLNALGVAAPRTLAGETAAGRLRFAALVASGRREEALELSYRLSFADGGRTVDRLEAWRELEAGNGDGVERALGSQIDPTPGERAALAIGRWQSGFRGTGAPGEEWMEVEGLPRVALALAAGARALAAGDAAGASRPVLSLRGASVPPAWQPAYAALSEPAGSSSDPSRDDVAAYREAASLFLEGRDEAAQSRLSLFLGQWPGSTHRPLAYLLRAHLHAAAGRSGEAESDLLAVERLPAPQDVVERAQILRAFLAAQGGRTREGVSILDAALRSGVAPGREGELRFDRIRILRLAGDGAGAEASILELEEAYPDQPWAARARGDGVPARWKEPWRSLPEEPEARRDVRAPTEGPWGTLLWGESVLSRTAEALVVPPEPGGAVVETPGDAPVPGFPRLVFGPTPPGRLGYLEGGLGSPALLSLGAGLGGATTGFLYRAEAGQLFGEGRNELPRFRRTDWELAGARLDDPVRVGGALEGTGRTDDDAPDLSLNPDPIDAYAWVGRFDLGFGNPDRTGLDASISRLWGDLDAGATGTWHTTQTWFELDGSARMGSSRWEGRWRSANFHYEQAGGEEDHGWHDLRLVLVRPSGLYVGGRGAIYRDRGLLLPILGIRGKVGPWDAWLRSEPGLSLLGFRETFLMNGDWNVPDFGLQAERKTLDIQGGLSSRNVLNEGITAQAEIYSTDELRTWRDAGPLWVEHAVNDADGLELRVFGETRLGPLKFSGDGSARSLRAEDRRVPYVPSLEGWIALAYEGSGWRAGTRLLGVDGREDEAEAEYGAFLRWDLEGALRLASPRFFFSEFIEVALRLDNVTGVEDRRWPGVPGYGRGVFLGVRTLYGTPAGM